MSINIGIKTKFVPEKLFCLKICGKKVEAAKMLAASSLLMHRVDVSLEHYDRVVEIISEKMLMAASYN